ncbi:hypothetical protein D3C81_2054670 [compost metagenome]
MAVSSSWLGMTPASESWLALMMIMNRMVLSPLQLSGSICSRTTVEQFDRVLTKVFVDDVSRAFRHEHRVAAGEGVLCTFTDLFG